MVSKWMLPLTRQESWSDSGWKSLNLLISEVGLKHLPALWETQVRPLGLIPGFNPWVWYLGWEDPLEKKMATPSSVLAWRIPWTEEPGRLQSTGSQRVKHEWATSLSLSLVRFWDTNSLWELQSEVVCTPQSQATSLGELLLILNASA